MKQLHTSALSQPIYILNICIRKHANASIACKPTANPFNSDTKKNSIWLFIPKVKLLSIRVYFGFATKYVYSM